MTDPPEKKRGGDWSATTPNYPALVDNTPLVCGAQRRSETSERESRPLLCLILQKLSKIEALLHSPLTTRRLHLRYCAKCGERVTNANVGGYMGKSALTGQLFCDLCADELEDPQ